MVLTGLFALVLALCGWATPANAEPVSISLLAAVGVTAATAGGSFATIVAVTTFVLTTTLSMALSFAVGALLRPTPAGKAAGGAAPIEATPYGTKINAKATDQAHPIIVGTTRVAGVAYPIAATNHNQFLHYIVVFAGHRINAYKKLWIGDEIFDVAEIEANGGFIPFSTGSKYAGMIRFHFYKGDPNATADADLVAEVPEWSTEHRGRGIAYIAMRLQFGPRGEQPALFSEGVPNVTCVIEGVCDVYDPRDGTYKFTDNPALLAAWFLCNQRYGFRRDYATSIKGPGPDYLGEDALVAAAQACDQMVPRKDQPDEKRYTANGILLSSDTRQTNLGRLLGAMAGKRAFDGETWFLFAGVYQPPTDAFTNNDLRGQGMVVDSVSPVGELFNCGKGKFYAEENNWQRTDFPVVKLSSYIATQGELWTDFDLPLTNSPSMAQRIVKIHLEQSQRQTRVKAPCSWKAWRTMAGNTITWTEMARRGWNAKPFEVRVLNATIEDGAICIDLHLTETAPGVYSWTSTEETILAEAPRTLLPDVTNVVPPANLIVAEELYVGRDGAGVKTRANLSWEQSPDYFVYRYRPRWRDAGGEWNILPDTTGLAVSIDDMTPGQKEFGVSAVNYVGNASPVISAVKELTGLLDPPQQPANMTMTPLGGGVYFRFDKSVDLDVIMGGSMVFRHSPALTGATWDTASPIGERLPGNSTYAFLPGKAGTYLARWVDSGGRYSESTVVVNRKQSSVLDFTPASGGTLQEDSTFTGTKTNCSVSGGKLGLTPGQAAGTYLWHAKMDLGSVKSVRLTVNQAVEVENSVDFWDSDEICDSEEPWDSAVTGNEAFAISYVRMTDDNPSGSPTWGEWMRIDTAELNARGFDFKTVFTAVDLSYVAKISALAAVAEEVV